MRRKPRWIRWSTQQLASKGFCNLWQDAGPQKVGLQSFDNFLWTSTLLARKLIYLENVKSILSKATAMQTVMKFLIKAGQPGQQFANLIPGILPNTFVCRRRAPTVVWSYRGAAQPWKMLSCRCPPQKIRCFRVASHTARLCFWTLVLWLAFFLRPSDAGSSSLQLHKTQALPGPTKYLWIMAWLENVKLLPTLWHQFWIIVKMFLDGRIAPCSPWALSSRRRSMIWILCQCRSGWQTWSQTPRKRLACTC